MTIEFWVEEPSMAAFLRVLLPRVLSEAEFEIYDFGDKQTLLRDAPGRLRSYARWIPEDYRVVILVDEDRQDCRALKSKLEEAATSAGLRTCRTHPTEFQVLNHIVVEELEAWLFGDPDALCTVYRGLPVTLGEKTPYREPDEIAGETWEALERELQRAGHYRAGIAKGRVASEVAEHLVPERNRSRSFRGF